jgi:hypothetical protein
MRVNRYERNRNVAMEMLCSSSLCNCDMHIVEIDEWFFKQNNAIIPNYWLFKMGFELFKLKILVIY